MMAEGSGPLPGACSVPYPPIAHRLREATRQAHRAIDHHPLMACLLLSPLSVEDYARALAGLHGPFGVMEASLVGFAPDQAFPFRQEDLTADLHDLGVSPFPFLGAWRCLPIY